MSYCCLEAATQKFWEPKLMLLLHSLGKDLAPRFSPKQHHLEPYDLRDDILRHESQRSLASEAICKIELLDLFKV